VLIFGESGGGAKTSCLYAMPEAAPFFNKASIESGPGVRMQTREAAAQTTAWVLKELNIAPQDWRKLLDVPAADLLRVQFSLPFLPPFQKRSKPGAVPGGFGPLVDGAVLPAHPFDPAAPAISAYKPLMTGWNEDEYTFFAWERKDISAFSLDFASLESKLAEQYASDAAQIVETYRKAMPAASAPDIFVAISSITMTGLGSLEIAEKKAAQQAAPVYLYQFGYKSEAKIPGTDYSLGTPHAMDITFKFNNETPEDGLWMLSGSRPERFIASRSMAELWTNFARHGIPAAADVPAWPAFNLSERASMRIDTNCTIINNRYSQEIAMWRAIGV
jgi:para-nitrobenzyl esterase